MSINTKKPTSQKNNSQKQSSERTLINELRTKLSKNSKPSISLKSHHVDQQSSESTRLNINPKPYQLNKKSVTLKGRVKIESTHN